MEERALAWRPFACAQLIFKIWKTGLLRKRNREIIFARYLNHTLVAGKRAFFMGILREEKSMDRCLSETISELSTRGLEVRPHQIHHALRMGRIEKPRLNAALNYLFNPEQVNQLEAYFASPVRPGRPKKTQDA